MTLQPPPEELKEELAKVGGRFKGHISVPGMRLSPSNDEFMAGQGTYESDGYIYANLAGLLKFDRDETAKVTRVSVETFRTPSIIPKPGDIVTATVNVVNPRMIHCVILCVGDAVLARPYRAILKKEEIRATNKDATDPYKCYRPGDVILARVLPTTEVHVYYLSTAENELGVVIATAEGSPQGVTMVPTSWSEMQCPKTLVKEPRKVARVLPENILTKTLVSQNSVPEQEIKLNGLSDTNIETDTHNTS